MDEVVWAINSRRDTLRDFATYVCKYAQTFFGSTPIRCRLDVEPELPTAAFDLPLRRNLFLAVKEALNNAVKHSGSAEVRISLSIENDGSVRMSKQCTISSSEYRWTYSTERACIPCQNRIL